ncbi:hypothetical protein E3P99_01196 [Wallemia hederae]|uniref:Vacuolar protein sorting-associated protein 54 C-terminal domain-containing protein n=1 Tax=Wallemia hederae TaxID=1540922 RepID=A0A4T0FW66_9BASI|nr:hypothetical protein E3P99_01196 [Wallemia hederae]
MVSSIPSSPASTRQSLDSAAESLAFSRASTRGDVPLSWSLDRYRGSPAAYTQSVGFNALSTVLNHPNKRPKALRASRYPLPAFPSVDLRLASTSAVDNYLHDIHGEYDTFIENTSQSAPSTSALPETELPSLDDIPSLFFKQDFDLGDPATFEAVTKTIGDSVGLENLESPEDIGINEILHARLEHHANAVDKVLVHELTERAPSLFSALDNLHFLGNYAKEALVKFSELKSTLEQDARSRLQSRYESISGIAARQGLEEALVVINDVESISQALLALHQMTELGHYFDALELVENISKTVVENIRSKDVDSVLKIQSETDFTALDVFASVSSDLEKHTSTILEAISKDLAETLFVDYSNSISESSHSHSGLAKDIEQSVCVLDRAGMLKQSLDSYEDRLLKHILQRFFDMLPESVRSKPLDLSQKLTGNLFASQFAKELRQMQQADYCAYLDKGREQLLAMILSSRSQGQALESISHLYFLADLRYRNEILISKISATTSQIMELVYSEISSIIRLRKDIEAELPLNEYLEFDRLMWRFIRETQVDSATSSSALFVLPAAASNQLQEFLELFHADYTTQSAKLVEMEVWSQAEVSPLVHKVLNLIIKSAVEDTPELLYSSPLVTGDDEKNETRINIEGLKFFTVEALNKVLVLLIDYLRIMIQVPNSATEIMTRIIEVLKQFNSRTCQVVLGAGAMKSAGLKNITAKHLALASQSLSVMVSLIPYIREAVRRQLSSNQTTLLIEFDRLKRDYQEHQYEIHAKLVSILGDRLTAHSKSLAATKFDKAKEEDIKKPNSYAEGLVKETATLHRVLNKYLPEATVQFVFKQVFDAINKRISDYYQRLPVKTELGKEKMLTDAHFLCNRLNALQGIDELGNDITDQPQSLISVAESRQISKTPVSSPRPSTSMDMDATARRSTSIDVQLRSSLERPRMSLSGVSRDTVQQIDEKEEHKEEHQEHQEHKEEPKDANDGQDEAAANADKSLPEVPHEMLQSEDPDVKSTYDGSKADKSVAEEHNAEEVAGSSTDQAVDEQQKDVTPLPAIERLEVSAEATEQPPASNVEEVHVKPASEPVEASKSEQEHQHGQVDGTHETHSEQRSEAQDRRDKGDASEGHAIITSPSAAQVEVDDPTTREPKSSDVDETDVAAVGPDAKKEALPDSAGNSAVKDVSQGLPEEDRPVDSKDVVDTNAGAAHAASTANEAPVDELSVDQPKVDDVAENTNEDGDDDAKMAEHNADVAVESVKQNEKAEDDAARNTSTEKPADEATGGTENPNKGKAANKTKAKNQKKRNKNKKK